jgi:hypothetical protein
LVLSFRSSTAGFAVGDILDKTRKEVPSGDLGVLGDLGVKLTGPSIPVHLHGKPLQAVKIYRRNN